MRRMISTFLLCLAALGTAFLPGQATAQEAEVNEAGQTPARLSYTDGEVSFWRSGAPDWSQAVVNTPLAPGDELAVASRGTLELQVGPRSFIRAWNDTQLGLSSQEPDFLQFKLTAGHASFDLRDLATGATVEVDTPNAAITIEHPGYYRVEIAGERTSIITRRGGRATVTPASGNSIAMLPSEEVVVEGSGATPPSSYAAPPPDDWDRWNYNRTSTLLEAVSARYVPPGTYGVDELDHYGTWRVVPEYGPLWIPSNVPADWAPYSTGSWIMDPYYGWTWVSSLRWGWAPFHHGRWVRLDRFWAWSPGPVVARTVYAPALVAFLGTPAFGAGVSIGAPLVGWVALGWGEPCVPWWGPVGFAHRPWWGGWGGPRVVNNVVVNQTTVVHVQNITVYRNTTVPNAVVAVQHERFGRGPITEARVRQADFRGLQPLHTGLPIQPTAASWVPTNTRGPRPSDDLLRRPVVATRLPRPVPTPSVASVARPAPAVSPATRIVSVTRPEPATTLTRPAFGQSPRERGMSDRGIPPRPPRQPVPQAKGPDKAGTQAASIRNAPAPTPQGAAQPAPGGGQPQVRRPVPSVATQTAPQAPAKAPVGAGGGMQKPAPQSGSPAAGAPVGPAPSRPVPPAATQTVPPAPGKAPVGAGGGMQKPAPQSGSPAAGAPAGPAPSRPALPAPAAGSSSYKSATPGSGPSPASQAVPKQYGGTAPMPGEPANRLAPHRVEGPRPKAPKPAADQQAPKP